MRETVRIMYRYFEELQGDLVEKVLYERLLSNEEIKLPYGKLVERIIYFKGRTTLGNS